MERVKDKSPEETESRFWSWVDKGDDCWNWTGVTRKGYGRFKLCGKYYTAHRFAYELVIGPIPEKMTLDHVVCGNRRCVNPAHVEIVTKGENTARSNRLRRGSSCGHNPSAVDDFYTYPNGVRQCRRCRYETRRRYRGCIRVRHESEVMTRKGPNPR